MATVSFAISEPYIKGYSQWSGLRLIESKQYWNFLNESTNSVTNCSIYNCNVGRLDAEICPTQLEIVANDLKTIPENLFVNCFARLNFLNVSNCGIVEISRHNFSYAYHLIKLDLSHNRIKKVPEHVFELAPSIEIIDLSYNNIGNYGIDSHAFEKCLSLKELYLSNNHVADIGFNRLNWVVPLTSLEVINLNDNIKNRESDFDFLYGYFYKNTNLVSLYARGSVSLNIGLDDSAYYDNKFPKLKHLIIYISHQDDKFQTNITKYYRDTFDANVSIVDTSGKNASSLGIPNNFKILIANNNQITSNRIECPEINHVVTELYLNQNLLTHIEFVQNLPNLEIADFSSNKLEIVNEDQLVKLKNLVELNLANNPLRQLNSCIMRQIVSLKVLDTSFNSWDDHQELSIPPITATIAELAAKTSSFNLISSNLRLFAFLADYFNRDKCIIYSWQM